MNGYLDMSDRTGVAGYSSASRSLMGNSGLLSEGYESQLFNKIIVSPRAIDAGFVLSVLDFNVAVWNTFYNRSHVLNSVTVTGGSGVGINVATPVSFPASAYRVYSISVDVTGEPTVDDLITFNFADGITGADVHITGTRLVVFSPRPNWDGKFKISISGSTDILASYDDHEQRVQRRLIPEYEFDYTVTTLDPQLRSFVDSLLWGWGGRVYGVPRWPDASQLTLTATTNSTSIYFDTTDRSVVAGGLLLLWQDPMTWEALTITQVASDHVVVSKPPQSNWSAATTIAMPMIQASLKDATHTSDTSGTSDLNVVFTSEIDGTTATPVLTGSAGSYAGYEMLNFVMPDWSSTAPAEFKRKSAVLNSKTGMRFIDDQKGMPTVVRNFAYAALTRAQRVQMEAFLLNRNGMSVPAWVPTWQQDIQLAQDVQPTATTLTIKDVSYSTLVFPSGPARRYLAFIDAALDITVVKVTGAVRNLGLGTETLTLSAPIGASFTTDTFISFLTLCRLDNDKAQLEYTTTDVCESTLKFHELPWETPA